MNQRATNAFLFKQANAGARTRYLRDGDKNAYIASSVYNAMKYLVDESATKNPRLRPVATGMSVLQHAIKGTLAKVTHDVREPNEDEDTHHSYFMDVKQEIEKHVQADIENYSAKATEALRHLGFDV